VNAFTALFFSGFAISVLTLVAVLAVSWSVRKQRTHFAQVQDEVQSKFGEQRDAFAGQIFELNRNIAVLELSQQNVEEGGRLTRSRRSQAMQLLRSGVTPESAAASLDIAAREMRLIAKVSRILSHH
jgi:hypothetical protein